MYIYVCSHLRNKEINKTHVLSSKPDREVTIYIINQFYFIILPESEFLFFI
jgi:hypothetical protein